MTKIYFGTAIIIILAFCHAFVRHLFGNSPLVLGILTCSLIFGGILQGLGLYHLNKERKVLDEKVEAILRDCQKAVQNSSEKP